MASAKEGDDESGDRRVLTDDDLGDIGAQGLQGGACRLVVAVDGRLGAPGGGGGRDAPDVRTSLSRVSSWSARRTSAVSSDGSGPKSRTKSRAWRRPSAVRRRAVTAGRSTSGEWESRGGTPTRTEMRVRVAERSEAAARSRALVLR